MDSQAWVGSGRLVRLMQKRGSVSAQVFAGTATALAAFHIDQDVSPLR